MIPFLVVSFAWFFQSITGFGAGIFIIGILSLLYDPKMVVVSSAIFNLFGTLSLLYQNRRGRIDAYLLLSLVAGSVPGIFLGAYLLDKTDTRTLKIIIGTFILTLGIYNLLVQKGFFKVRLSRHAGVPVGFVGGLFAGLVGMGGPPPLVFLSQHISDPYSIRLMLNLYFTSNILVRLGFYQGFDVVNLNLGFIAMGLAGLLVGTLAGGMLAEKIPARVYSNGVSYAVVLLGLVMLIMAEAGL
ncbi:MAG: sulfite exporter TauE/SafE family protein [Aquificaceae bacterium]|uniref:sulfite exporter TauE/SafE family protein n=1 Tax=Hydrogenobacter sp. Uz 6-8 TaxID=3384828 RepID=UPI00309B1F3C